MITTFVFQVRNIPAALYKALGGFATNGINMTKLESYMVDGSFAATQFYADVQGHPKERALELALEELEFVSQPKSLKILGVYPAHRFRKTSSISTRGSACRVPRQWRAGDDQRSGTVAANAAPRIHPAGADPDQSRDDDGASAPFYQLFENAQLKPCAMSMIRRSSFT